MRTTSFLFATTLMASACGGAAATAPTASTANAAATGAADDPAVRAVDATTLEIDRALLDEALASVDAAGSQVRAVEYRADASGPVVGFKLFGIAAGSPFERLGLLVGDVLTVVNGIAVTSTDALMQAHGTLGGAAAFDLELLRAGAPLVLHYQVR